MALAPACSWMGSACRLSNLTGLPERPHCLAQFGHEHHISRSWHECCRGNGTRSIHGRTSYSNYQIVRGSNVVVREHYVFKQSDTSSLAEKNSCSPTLVDRINIAIDLVTSVDRSISSITDL